MNTNPRVLFAVIAAFAAGALIFVPLQSFAKAQGAQGQPQAQGQIVFQPGVPNQFVVFDDGKVTLIRIERDILSKKDKFAVQDSQVVTLRLR